MAGGPGGSWPIFGDRTRPLARLARSDRPSGATRSLADVLTDITDFLTDASFVALCNSLGQLTRAQVTVHDREGRRIIFTRGDPPWMLAPADVDATLVADAMRNFGPSAGVVARDGRLVEPLMIAGQPIGAVVIAADPLRVSAADLERLRTVVGLLASTVNELCENDVLLRQRNAELSVLFRLSSLLVTARDVDAVLNVALRSAVELLNADAAAIHLRDEESGRQTLRAHVGLSERFIARAVDEFPGGQLLRDLLRDEGLEGVISGNLLFSGQTLGKLRLFNRKPDYLDGSQQALLQTIIEQVSAAVASTRLIESEHKARHMERQLALAADVQRRMLPRVIPTHKRLDIDARYIPSLELSGDFYDLIELKGHLGVLVGDVAGKGVPAALLMASVRSALRAHAGEVYNLDEVMARTNEGMVRDTLAHEFATVFYGVIDPSTLRMTYCNAGHDPPLLLRPPKDRAPTEADLWELTSGGMAIGIDGQQTYERGMFDLERGDVFFAYTDGLIDARDFAGRKFTRPRLRAALVSFLAANPGAEARAIADHIVWEIRRFVGLNPAVDDETLVVIRVRQ